VDNFDGGGHLVVMVVNPHLFIPNAIETSIAGAVSAAIDHDREPID
jgi:hypothetical protein